jgi:hypothetical protein
MSSPLSQCVGPEFDVEDGTGALLLRLAGGPAGAALPASGNGLRVDPDKGAWAPAEHTAVSIAASREDAPGGAIVYPGNQRLSGTLSKTVTNPSATRSALLLVTVRATMEHKIPAAASNNAGYTGWSLLLGFDVDASSSAPDVSPVLVRRDHGVDHEATLIHQVSDTFHVTLAPGATSTVRARCGLSVYDFGYGKYVRSYLALRGIGATL